MPEVLQPDAFHRGLDTLDGWSGSRERGIDKGYTFDDFDQAMSFVNAVAEIAEEMRHHPDISIRWNRVELTIVGHSAGGVTQSCLDLAGRIDRETASS